MKSFFVLVSEFLELFYLKLKVAVRNSIEFLKVAIRYYRDFHFCKLDLSLLRLYLFANPFKISKRHMEKKGVEDVHVYGETPLTTLELIANECGIRKNDVVYELGCGRGRNCFWLHRFIGCRVLGIEWIPEFVAKASRIKERYCISGVDFVSRDMLDLEYSNATVIYLYGTCLDDTFIKMLLEKFYGLKAGTKIITVSYPLSDYVDENHRRKFEVMKRFSAPFPWGEADVYLQLVAD